MTKLDLSSAYRRVAVHPDDSHLLGIDWQGTTYIDETLPFRLCSAPKIFTSVADGLAWAMKCRGVKDFIHYLDDFFFCSPALSQACQEALSISVSLCAELGRPTAPNKLKRKGERERRR